MSGHKPWSTIKHKPSNPSSAPTGNQSGKKVSPNLRKLLKPDTELTDKDIARNNRDVNRALADLMDGWQSYDKPEETEMEEKQ
jgi:hypothetical protein